MVLYFCEFYSSVAFKMLHQSLVANYIYIEPSNNKISKSKKCIPQLLRIKIFDSILVTPEIIILSFSLDLL